MIEYVECGHGAGGLLYSTSIDMYVSKKYVRHVPSRVDVNKA